VITDSIDRAVRLSEFNIHEAWSELGGNPARRWSQQITGTALYDAIYIWPCGRKTQ